jgi:hypothetical protein
VVDLVVVQVLQGQQQRQDDLGCHVRLLQHAPAADELLEQVALRRRRGAAQQRLAAAQQAGQVALRRRRAGMQRLLAAAQQLPVQTRSPPLARARRRPGVAGKVWRYSRCSADASACKRAAAVSGANHGGSHGWLHHAPLSTPPAPGRWLWCPQTCPAASPRRRSCRHSRIRVV